MSTTADPLRAAQPETAAALARMREVAWETTDAELLELCRLRVAALLGADHAPERPDVELTERELAFRAFTEQFVFSVASVTDAQVDALLRHADAVEVYRFVAALYSLEMSLRVELAGRVVLGPEEVAA